MIKKDKYNIVLYVPICAGDFRFLRPRKRFRPSTAGNDIDETPYGENSTSAYAVTERMKSNFQRTNDMSKSMPDMVVMKTMRMHCFLLVSYCNGMFAENKEGRAKNIALFLKEP